MWSHATEFKIIVKLCLKKKIGFSIIDSVLVTGVLVYIRQD